MEWVKCSEQLPQPMQKVLIFNGNGMETAFYSLGEPDQEQQPGFDAGFVGETAFPSRTFGNPEYFFAAICQPSHWMPLPEPPGE